MNDILKDRLKAASEDSVLMAALTALFDERVEKEKPQVGDEDDQGLGQKFRAYETAKKITKEILQDLKSYQFVVKQDIKFHKER